MKKILCTLVCLLTFFPMLVNAQEKVKVYVFEAGGCGYCEAQIEYLKGLDSYNEKFEIVEKELYVDNVKWEEGKDFDLGVKVVEAFNNAGYQDATYDGTPLVIISDIYAATTYTEDLEDYILYAYNENNSYDAVACIEDGNDECVFHKATASEEVNDNITSSSEENSNTIVWIVVACTIVLTGSYLIKSTIDTNRIIEALKRR